MPLTKPVCNSVQLLRSYIIIGDSPAPLPPREEGIAELKDWLKTNGAVFDKVDCNTIIISIIYVMLLPTNC